MYHTCIPVIIYLKIDWCCFSHGFQGLHGHGIRVDRTRIFTHDIACFKVTEIIVFLQHAAYITIGNDA